MLKRIGSQLDPLAGGASGEESDSKQVATKTSLSTTCDYVWVVVRSVF